MLQYAQQCDFGMLNDTCRIEFLVVVSAWFQLCQWLLKPSALLTWGKMSTHTHLPCKSTRIFWYQCFAKFSWSASDVVLQARGHSQPDIDCLLSVVAIKDKALNHLYVEVRSCNPSAEAPFRLSRRELEQKNNSFGIVARLQHDISSTDRDQNNNRLSAQSLHRTNPKM